MIDCVFLIPLTPLARVDEQRAMLQRGMLAALMGQANPNWIALLDGRLAVDNPDPERIIVAGEDEGVKVEKMERLWQRALTVRPKPLLATKLDDDDRMEPEALDVATQYARKGFDLIAEDYIWGEDVLTGQAYRKLRRPLANNTCFHRFTKAAEPVEDGRPRILYTHSIYHDLYARAQTYYHPRRLYTRMLSPGCVSVSGWDEEKGVDYDDYLRGWEKP